MKSNIAKREKIKFRIRKKIVGTNIRPRLSVFRSNSDIYVQLIDDYKSITLVSSSSKAKEIVSKKDLNKTEKSKLVGITLANKANDLGIFKCVFDRSGNLYHGRIKALAEGARANGLQF